jgi:mono/diheme cytochrome c family protein
MSMRTLLSRVALGAVLLCAGCGGPPLTTLEPEPGDSKGMQTAKMTYKVLCSTCHGMTGEGDGPAGKVLTPQPRTLRDKEWQASVTDEHIYNIIVGGGAAVGKSPLMPGAPNLKGDEEALKALVAIVRWLGSDSAQ